MLQVLPAPTRCLPDEKRNSKDQERNHENQHEEHADYLPRAQPLNHREHPFSAVMHIRPAEKVV